MAGIVGSLATKRLVALVEGSQIESRGIESDATAAFAVFVEIHDIVGGRPADRAFVPGLLREDGLRFRFELGSTSRAEERSVWWSI
jgi:hypothetical protein